MSEEEAFFLRQETGILEFLSNCNQDLALQNKYSFHSKTFSAYWVISNASDSIKHSFNSGSIHRAIFVTS